MIENSIDIIREMIIKGQIKRIYVDGWNKQNIDILTKELDGLNVDVYVIKNIKEYKGLNVTIKLDTDKGLNVTIKLDTDKVMNDVKEAIKESLKRNMEVIM